MSNTAPRLNSQLFQEDWNASPSSNSQEAKISYLMVEQVTPPAYLWEKIAHKLDTQENQATAVQEKPQTGTIALMIAAAGLVVAAILYWLV